MKTICEIRPIIKGLAFCSKDDLEAGDIYIELSRDGEMHLGIFVGSHIIRDGRYEKRRVRKTSRYVDVTSIIMELELADWTGE